MERPSSPNPRPNPARIPAVTPPPGAVASDILDPERRSFFAKATAVFVGLLVGVVPLASGIFVFLDPLGRKGGGAQVVRVASLASVPADGLPRRFPVILPVVDDAWNRSLNVPAGSVFIERSASGEVKAWNTTCPHAGCSINYEEQQHDFLCPCHGSRFSLDGARIDPATSPSPRDMDSLQCETRGDEIWVRFENFQIATPEKIPKV